MRLSVSKNNTQVFDNKHKTDDEEVSGFHNVRPRHGAKDEGIHFIFAHHAKLAPSQWRGTVSFESDDVWQSHRNIFRQGK